MTTIDPSALLEPLKIGIADYQGPAPAVLVEVARDGLSAQTANGVLTAGQDALATTDAKFQIGSQTKMITATVVLQMAAEGLFSLDHKLSDVMDVSGLSGIANIEDATLRQLMTHSSGIPDYVNDFVNETGAPTLWERLLEIPPRQIGVVEAIEFLIGQNAPADFAPGEMTKYSNTGFLLLQLAIEHVTGRPLANALQERIFDPVGMADSSFPGFGRPDGIISSYATIDDELFDVTHLPMDDAGDGGVVSTTADMIKFMQALVLDRTLVPDAQLDGLGEFFDAVGFSEGDFVGHNGGTAGTTSVTLVHMPTGTIVSLALTHANEVENLSTLFSNVMTSVLANEAWSEYETGEGPFDFELTAAELGVEEQIGPDGMAQIELDMQGVSLILDGTLAELDTSGLTFHDGSILYVAEQSGAQFSVANDAVEALQADNHLIGQSGDDLLIGGLGNDVITGGVGDDHLVGLEGQDVARYLGEQTQFTLTIGQDGTSLTDRSGTSGTDFLTSIEQIDFASGSIDLQALDDVATVSALDLMSIVELYTAYFNRAPDAVGLHFWGTAFANGTTLEQTASLFDDQDETRALYSSSFSNDDFVSAVYTNVLGRVADQVGYDFWVAVLDEGSGGRDQLILEVLNGAKAVPPADASLDFVTQQLADQIYLANKIDLGAYFAVHKGMSNVENASAAMTRFDGSENSLNAVIALIDGFHHAALSATDGEYLMPLVGVLGDPFDAI